MVMKNIDRLTITTDRSNYNQFLIKRVLQDTREKLAKIRLGQIFLDSKQSSRFLLIFSVLNISKSKITCLPLIGQKSPIYRSSFLQSKAHFEEDVRSDGSRQ